MNLSFLTLLVEIIQMYSYVSKSIYICIFIKIHKYNLTYLNHALKS